MTRRQTRGSTNRNARGNTTNRRARRQWLLDTFGDGVTVRCQLRATFACRKNPAVLDIDTVSVDCWPIPRCDGGTYERTNIRPACDHCQSRQGGLMAQARRRARTQVKAAS